MNGATLFAWTSVGDYRSYPQYINVSRRDGAVVITVRAPEDLSGEYPMMGTSASCTLPDEAVVQLIASLYLNEMDPALTRIAQARGLLDVNGHPTAPGQSA